MSFLAGFFLAAGSQGVFSSGRPGINFKCFSNARIFLAGGSQGGFLAADSFFASGGFSSGHPVYTCIQGVYK